MNTYSFLDVKAAIVGPGGAFNLSGGQVGSAEEGIDIAMTEEKNTMTGGADGSIMHSLHGGKSAHVSVHLLKTSPLNALLSAMYNLQTTSSASHGLNVITIANPVTGDTVACQQCAFAKHPDNNYQKEGGTMTWEFHAGIVDSSLAGLLLAQ